ncbi:MAG TPA: hypothetical protein VFP98_01425, partial [Candidatus Polarisedimenticolia bacterium]|nr:hypothetical protein [Candidatus Polarisedimenticolia bacterium]
MKRSLFVLAAAAVASAGLAAGGSTPSAINYQGVLLNPSGAPEDGDRDMIFHFHDAAGGGEILRDLHTRADSSPVTVGAGMFNVQLGGGLLQDGTGGFPNDPYASLEQVFRDFPEVLLEVEVRVGEAGGSGAFETLAPMTRIVSAPYAINAGLLSGKGPGEFIDRSTTPQTKAGDLTVANLTATGTSINFSSAGASLAATATSFFLNAGSQDTDNLFLIAGNSGDDGGITIFGDGPFEMRAGNGQFSFVDGVTLQQRALLNGGGDFQIDGDMLVTGNDIFFGQPGAAVVVRPTNLNLMAGDLDTDDLLLVAGNSSDDGRVAIFGDDLMELRSGNGEFSLVNGATGLERAHLDAAGNLQIDGTLTLGPGHKFGTLFFSGLQIWAGPGHSIDVVSNDFLTSHINFDGNLTATADWCANGGCSGSNHLMELQQDGDLRIGGTLLQNQFDLAESYLAGEPLEPGDLVRLHPGRPGAVLLSAGVEDQTVLGVVSERPGVVLGGAPFGVDRLERMWGRDIRERYERQRGRLVEETAALLPVLVTDEPSHGPDRIETLALEAFYAESFVPVALAGRVPVTA